MAEQSPITSSIQIENSSIYIRHLEGKAFREGTVPGLGKRLVCGQQVEVPIVKPDGSMSAEQRLLTGEVSTEEGLVNMGCGTEILTIKPPSKHFPRCCDIPMSVLQPKVLPSAD